MNSFPVLLKRNRDGQNPGEAGFVLVVAMVFLTILSFMAVSGIKKTTTEFKISGNDRISKVNFYNAESAALIGVQRNLNLDDSKYLLPNDPDFDEDVNPSLITVLDEDDDLANLDLDDNGLDAEDLVEVELVGDNVVEGKMAELVTLNGIPAGSSLGMETTSLYDFTSYGFAESKNGSSLIKIGFKKRF